MKRTNEAPAAKRLPRAVAIATAAATLASCSAHEQGHEAKPIPSARPTATAAGKLVTHLIFSSNRTGHYEIYDKNLANGRLKPLTEGPSDNMNPQVSPDKSELVFYSNRDGNNQIYKLDMAQPEHVTRLTNNTANEYDPVFTRNGKKILYKSNQSDGLGDIWSMSRDGSGQRNLTPDLDRTEEWKPEPVDGGTFVYTTMAKQGENDSNDLYRKNTRTSVTVRLTDNNVPDWYPSYSPAASKLAFISKERPGDSDSIYTMNLDGSERTPVVQRAGDSDDPAWSQDGKRLAFVNNGDGAYSIYGADANGSNVQLLDKSPQGEDLSPQFVQLPPAA